MFKVQIKTAFLKRIRSFRHQKRKYIHIYVYSLSCKRHNGYKRIEI